jgi:AcrR family transcriptional regulator
MSTNGRVRLSNKTGKNVSTYLHLGPEQLVCAPMDVRDKLIESAARVFAEAGYRGATTRRIAQDAGVNEITLFRHFGNKDALLSEAVRIHGAPTPAMPELPERPGNPAVELEQWCKAQHAFLLERRALIRNCMGEMEEHPGVGHPAKAHPHGAAAALASYFERISDVGLTTHPFNPAAPAWMLLAAVFGDAMWRGILPELYGESADEAIAEYVRLTLSSIGIVVTHVTNETPAPRARTA